MSPSQEPQSRPGGEAGGGEAPEVDPKQLKAVKSVLDKFQVALKTYSLFPPDNVNVRQTLEGFERSLNDYFEAHGDELPFETTPTQFRFEKAIVYENPDKGKSISFRMNKDGIKQLIFEEGIERQEVMNFFDVFKEIEHADEMEDDFVTILWEKDCPHIRTQVMDEQIDPAALPDIPSAKDMLKRSYGGAATLAAPPEAESGTPDGGSSIPDTRQLLSRMSPDILALSEEEKKALQARIEAECKSSPLLDLMDILFEIFQLDNDWATFQDMARLVKKTLESVVLKKKFALSRVILEKIAGLRERRDLLQSNHIQELDRIIEDLGTGEPMQVVKAMLMDPNQHVPEDCWEYLKRLRRNAAPSLFEILRADQYPKALIPILAAYGQAEFNLYAPALEESNPGVVGNVMELLIQVDARRAIPLLIPLLQKREDPFIQTRCIEVLAKSDHPEVSKVFLPFIHSKVHDIRLAILAYFVRNPNRSAFDPLYESFQKRISMKMDVFEQEQTLTAMGRSDPDRGYPFFESVLRKKTWLWFLRPALEETQKRVVFALARLPGSHPLEILKAFAEAKEAHVARLCKSALGFRGGTAPASAGLTNPGMSAAKKGEHGQG